VTEAVSELETAQRLRPGPELREAIDRLKRRRLLHFVGAVAYRDSALLSGTRQECGAIALRKGKSCGLASPVASASSNPYSAYCYTHLPPPQTRFTQAP
jgi:hypothetical protein